MHRADEQGVRMPVTDSATARVDIVIATFRQTSTLRVTLSSLQSQTVRDWRALVVHDGPGTEAREVVRQLSDSRIVYLETPSRANDWGHSTRRFAISSLSAPYTVFTNGDNYYVPVFIERMLTASPAQFIHCDMLHNHAQFDYRTAITTRLHNGHIDCGAVMVSTELVRKVGWRSSAHDADWHFIADVLAVSPSIAKIDRVLFVHN